MENQNIIGKRFNNQCDFSNSGLKSIGRPNSVYPNPHPSYLLCAGHSMAASQLWVLQQTPRSAAPTVFSCWRATERTMSPTTCTLIRFETFFNKLNFEVYLFISRYPNLLHIYNSQSVGY